MLELQRILFPTDFSPCARQAMDWALFLAEDFGAGLHLLHAVAFAQAAPLAAESPIASAEELLEDMARQARSELGRLVDEARAGRTLEVHAVERRGFSAGVIILDYAGEIGADLIVMGSHGRRRTARLLLGSVAEEVVRHAACPVLVLREPPASRPLTAPQRILVPIDFSAHSAPAVAMAAALAARYRTSLRLLHVVDLTPLPPFYGALPDAAAAERLRERAIAELRALARETVGAEGLAWECAVREGRAAEEIVRCAEEDDSGLVVMPSHGRSGLERALIGSTAERVLRLSRRPVLVLRRPAG